MIDVVAIAMAYAKNPVFTGMLGAGVIGGAAVVLRQIPSKLWHYIRGQFVLTLTVYSGDDIHRFISVWLGQKMEQKRSQNLSVMTMWDDDKDRNVHKIVPGPGLHLMRFNNRHFLIERKVSDGAPEGAYSTKRQETLTIQTIARDKAVFESIIEESCNVLSGQGTVSVFTYGRNGYSLAGRRMKRPLETVYMDADLKAAIIADILKFLEQRAWYASRGIPWRRGYSFEGPPGTGKTSLIFAIASFLNKPIYIINPATLVDDNELREAINSAGSGIVVIEDIDSVEILEQRPTKVPKKDKSEVLKMLTLSGFLNAIDGIASQEGRLLFITTNCADKLDAALLRPGRIDMRVHMGLADMAVALQMHAQFYPDGDVDAFRREIAAQLPLAPAALQNHLLKLDKQPLRLVA